VPRESRAARAKRAAEIARLLAEEYPGSARQLCALEHRGPFQLLVATILSAQCTDERVNLVTPALFARYRDPEEMAAADPAELEGLIKSTGFFRTKASHLIGMASALASRHPGAFPSEMEELTALPGVGRKTANVVRSVALSLPGLPVDTHVLRLSRRLGLTSAADPVKIEADLCALLPEEQWGAFSLRLILHGRAVCSARRPRCSQCVLAPHCPSAGIGALGPDDRKRGAR
jgi:endonuclease-3